MHRQEYTNEHESIGKCECVHVLGGIESREEQMGDELGENVDLGPTVKVPVKRYFPKVAIRDSVGFGDINRTLEVPVHTTLKGKGLHTGENRNTTRPSPVLMPSECVHSFPGE